MDFAHVNRLPKKQMKRLFEMQKSFDKDGKLPSTFEESQQLFSSIQEKVTK